MASETGVLPVKPEDVKMKGRLQPGKMLLVDTVEGRIISDTELKRALYGRNPYQLWLKENQITLDQLAEPPRAHGTDHETLLSRQRAFGYTDEDLRIDPRRPWRRRARSRSAPWAPIRRWPVSPTSRSRCSTTSSSSSRRSPIRPSIPIREEMVMSLISYIGTERNILDETPQHCHTLKLPHPILTNRDLEKLRRVTQGDFLATTLPMLFPGGGWRQGSGTRARRSSAAAPRWPSSPATRC